MIDQKKIILDELNVKSLKRVKDENELIEYKIKPNLPVLGQKHGKYLKLIQNRFNDLIHFEVLSEIRSQK